MRQLTQLIGFLIDLILHQGKNSILKQEEVMKQAYTAAGFRKEDFLTGNDEDITELFEDSETGINQMELMGYVLLEEAKKENDPDLRSLLLSRSMILLEYVDGHSNVYSIERRMILNELSLLRDGEGENA